MNTHDSFFKRRGSGCMDNQAMFKISYGLYVITAKNQGKDNGCIVNTVTQVTSSPNRITVAINKQNLTHDMIIETGKFNVSALSIAAPFEVFTHFGFQTGRNADKFKDYEWKEISNNGILYIPKYSNAFLSCNLVSTLDLGTHTQFLADVVDCEILSNEESVTYTYYQNNIKPKPKQETKKGFRCKICNYVYEGDTLPEDYICPICKHGSIDFEPVG